MKLRQTLAGAALIASTALAADVPEIVAKVNRTTRAREGIM